ncbi:MAG TPA: hypothetical protein VE866_15700, partial [Candidatus Binatia bacterium]|nr:hypothetical protein [Candidatus Binatia bacterium]
MWAIACLAIILLIAGLVRVEYRIAHPTVPPGIQRSECLTPTPQGATEKDNFLQRGGHIIEHP